MHACGRGPSYSGRLIARAIQLYREGVKPGYLRWDELQYILQTEFPDEFRAEGEDRPTPETVLHWVRNYSQAPQSLKRLGISVTPAGDDITGRQLGTAVSPPQRGSVTSIEVMSALNLATFVCAWAIALNLIYSLIYGTR